MNDRIATAREQQRVAETRRIEATKPFLERQLALYTEATQVASIIGTSQNTADVAKAKVRFWRLYWGELGLVEDKDVEGAMKRLGDALSALASQDDLKHYSLALAHACRVSLDRSWGISAWTSGSTIATEAKSTSR